MIFKQTCQRRNNNSFSVSSIKESLQDVIYSLNFNEVSIIEETVVHKSRGQLLFASQFTLGKWIGVSRKTINKATGVLKRIGLLEVTRRPYNSNVYDVPGWFYNPTIQKVIWRAFSEIKKLSTKLSTPRVTVLDIKIKSSLLLVTYVTNLKHLLSLSGILRLAKKERVRKSKELLYIRPLYNLVSSIAKSFFIKNNGEGERMTHQSEEILLTNAIQSIRSIKLTRAGEACLRAFQPQAIMLADKRLSKKNDIDHPFKYFCKVCHSWHKEHNVDANNGAVTQYMAENNIPDGQAKFVQGAKPSILPEQLSFKGRTFRHDMGEIQRRTVPSKDFSEQMQPDVLEKVRQYHAKLRPSEYEQDETGELVRKESNSLTLEEELSLSKEERLVIIERLANHWDGKEASALRMKLGDKLVFELYSTLINRLVVGK